MAGQSNPSFEATIADVAVVRAWELCDNQPELERERDINGTG